MPDLIWPVPIRRSARLPLINQDESKRERTITVWASLYSRTKIVIGRSESVGYDIFLSPSFGRYTGTGGDCGLAAILAEIFENWTNSKTEAKSTIILRAPLDCNDVAFPANAINSSFRDSLIRCDCVCRNCVSVNALRAKINK